MKIAKIKIDGRETAAFVIPRGYVPIERVNEEKRSFWETDADKLINGPDLPMLNKWYMAGGRGIIENLSRKFVIPPEEAETAGEIYLTEDEK